MRRWCASFACGPSSARRIATRFTSFPTSVRQLDAGQYIVWDGDKPQNTCLLLSGFAYRHKAAGNGGRQILSIHMKGDLVDLQNSLLGVGRP